MALEVRDTEPKQGEQAPVTQAAQRPLAAPAKDMDEQRCRQGVQEPKQPRGAWGRVVDALRSERHVMFATQSLVNDHNLFPCRPVWPRSLAELSGPSGVLQRHFLFCSSRLAGIVAEDNRRAGISTLPGHLCLKRLPRSSVEQDLSPLRLKKLLTITSLRHFSVSSIVASPCTKSESCCRAQQPKVTHIISR